MAAVLDEYLVGVHARDNHAGQINSGPFAFQGMRISARALRFGLDCDACRVKKLQVGTVADQRENKIVL